MKISLEKIVPNSFQLHIDGSNHYLSLSELLSLSCFLQRRIAAELSDPQFRYVRGQILRDTTGGIFVLDRIRDGYVYAFCGIRTDGISCDSSKCWGYANDIAGLASTDDINLLFKTINEIKK